MSIFALVCKRAYAASSALLFLPLAAAGQATTNLELLPIRTNVISACANNRTGDARIVAAKKDCKESESFYQWNVVGIQGPAGPAGATGKTGAAGPAGATGPIGPIGPTGAAGKNGAQGVAGPIGPVGPQGVAGNTGAQGVAGPIGPIGPQGVAGNTGAQGPAGPAGPTGPQGAMGPQGPAGMNGTATIPANLTALSQGIGTLGTLGGFDYQGQCVLGTLILSPLSFGEGALPADGRLLPIQGNTALFSLLGTNFGGNGTTNFALPNLTYITPNGLNYSICSVGIFPARD